jgi:hypothetical protein
MAAKLVVVILSKTDIDQPLAPVLVYLAKQGSILLSIAIEIRTEDRAGSHFRVVGLCAKGHPRRRLETVRSYRPASDHLGLGLGAGKSKRVIGIFEPVVVRNTAKTSVYLPLASLELERYA